MITESYLVYLVAFIIFIAATLLFVGIGKIINELIIRKKLIAKTKDKKIIENLSISREDVPNSLEKILKPLLELSSPDEQSELSEIKIKFLQAGIRNPNVAQYYYGTKTLLFLVLPLVASFPVSHYIQAPNSYLILFLCAALGYYLPDISLRHRIKKRFEEMRDSLPDFMDLLVMSSEAGLGLDAALNRVAIEINKSSPTLSEEIYLACLEIRAGGARIAALKNLALRANLDDLNNLVLTLAQAEKYGTSLSNALRASSDYMRVKRMQRAEEQAAKLPVKLLLPMGVFIFPTLFIVLLGPAVIQFYTVFK